MEPSPPVSDIFKASNLDKIDCNLYPDAVPHYPTQYEASEANSEIHNVAKVFLLFEYLIGNLFETLKEVSDAEKLSEFNVTIERMESIYRMTADLMRNAAGSPENSRYKTSLEYFERAASHMEVFWRDLRSAIQLKNINQLNEARNEFLVYRLNLLAAVSSIPAIQVSSLMANTDLLIDPNNPQYGYISVSLLDDSRKLITTRLKKEDYQVYIADSAVRAEAEDIQSKPKLQNETRIILLLSDVSGSMSSTDPTLQRVAAAKKIADTLGQNDILVLGTFGLNGGTPVTSFHGYGSGSCKDCLKILIEEHFSKAVGATPLFASMSEGIMKLDELRTQLGNEGSPVTFSLIVLTDGANTFTGNDDTYRVLSNPFFAAYAARKLSIPIYTIGLSDGADNGMLYAIAKTTNGLFGTTKDSSGLNEIFDNYSRALEGQTFMKIKFSQSANSLRGSIGTISIDGRSVRVRVR